MNKINVVITSFALVLVACQSNRPIPSQEISDELQKAQQAPSASAAPLTEIPKDVAADLMPELPKTSLAGQMMLNEKRFNINAEGIEAKTFFGNLVTSSDYSVVIHPDVSGDISLSLKNVTISEIMELAQDIYGYDIRQKGRIFQILPAGMRTETFAVNYLNLKRDGRSSTSITTGSVSENSGQGNNTTNNSNNQQNNQNNNQNGQGNTNGSNSGTNINTANDADFWEEIKTNLAGLIGNKDGRRVVVSPQAGLVVVHAYPDEIRAVEDFLTQAELILQRQVILEAKIIEVALNDQFQQGINWVKMFDDTVDSAFGIAMAGGVTNNEISSRLGGLVSLVVADRGNNGSAFEGVVDLLSTQGNVQVLSNPRLTASNNQKAVIKVGKDEYFVTSVSTTTVTGTATSTTPNIGLTPFFSGIALDVTPQIDGEGNVVLHVHPSVIDTSEQNKVVSLNGSDFSLPLAQSNIRESDTVIQAKSGEVVVLGGLMQSSTTDESSKIPLLGDIPVVGTMFTNKNQKELKKELVILLKPTVVGKGTWQQEIKRSSELLEGWYQAKD